MFLCHGLKIEVAHVCIRNACVCHEDKEITDTLKFWAEIGLTHSEKFFFCQRLTLFMSSMLELNMIVRISFNLLTSP